MTEVNFLSFLEAGISECEACHSTRLGLILIEEWSWRRAIIPQVDGKLFLWSPRPLDLFPAWNVKDRHLLSSKDHTDDWPGR